MKRILRYFLAIIFIISGGVKAIDVRGFSFKLEEYFSPTVFNIPILAEIAIPIAFFVIGIELILGFMLLFKIQFRFTILSLIALCIFFAFLTFYSAYFNVVTDCGCFGDAIKFTPWQSFYKDIFLLILLFLLWKMNQKYFKELQKTGKLKLILSFILISGSIGLMIYGMKYEPIIDFRDYKIGTNLKIERKKYLENPDVYKTFYVLKNKKNGEEKKINQDDYVNDKSFWEEGTPWEIQSDKTTSEVVKKGYKTEIHKLRLEDLNGVDKTDEILNLPKVYLIFRYKEYKGRKFEDELISGIVKQNPWYYVTPEKTKRDRHLQMDATPIKTIARSNPFVLELENGVIKNKMSLEEFYKINNL